MTNLNKLEYIQSLKSILENGNEIPKSDMKTIVNYGKNFIISLQGALFSWNKPAGLEMLSKLKEEVFQFRYLTYEVKEYSSLITAEHDINSSDLKKSFIPKRLAVFTKELNQFNIERIKGINEILGAFQFNKIYQPKY